MGAREAVKRETVGLPDRVVPLQASLLGENGCVGEAAAAPARAPGAPGRPPGSENRDTVEMRRYLASLGYRPGQVALAELGSGASLDELIARARKIAAELPCKPIEAMRLVLEAVKEYSTYTGSRTAAPPPAAALPAGVVIIQASDTEVKQLSDGVVFIGAKGAENGEILDVTPRQSDTSQSDTSSIDQQ